MEICPEIQKFTLGYFFCICALLPQKKTDHAFEISLKDGKERQYQEADMPARSFSQALETILYKTIIIIGFVYF